ncbi:hypothetical protein GGQ72_001348 [Rhizobium rhizoryzae]|uniref:Uncharacterized protein n=1 Tax=Rhizobium rhizoryzae TaxID=451876 RepID=A0A7W6LEC5_9HYPH|nr:hypothetical protein [Rhizobium rhizoryzae]
MRSRHPKKDVETVLCELEALGWTVEVRGGGHAGAFCGARPTQGTAVTTNIAR